MVQTRAAGLFLALSLALAITGCNGQTSTPGNAGLRRGIGGEPSSLDPAHAADNYSFEVLRDLYEGLTTDGPNGEILPGVAKSWTVDPTGTEYTFELRPDAEWSNGKPIVAQDFIDAWRRVVDPREASPVADDLRVILGAGAILEGKSAPETLGAYAPSASKLIVKLEKSAPYLPQLLTHSAAFPVYMPSLTKAGAPKLWVSNGPYVLSAWYPGTRVTLTRNARYWDKASVHVKEIEYQIADEISQYARYRAGQLDITDSVPPSAITTIQENIPSELVVAPFLATAYYGLNLSMGPFAENLPLRQSIAMAIDRKLLSKSLAFGQVGAYGFVPPGTSNYTPQSWPWRDLGDTERINEARRLYAAAGYSRERPLHIRLLFNSNPYIKNTAIVIAQMWRETLGIETALTDEEYRVFLQSRHDRSRWDVVRLGWTADYDDASNFLDIFRKYANNNDTGYSNPSFDGLLDEAAQQSDPIRRSRILEKAERKMLGDYPILPLYFYVSKRLVKPYIQGARVNPLNRMPSKSLSFADR